jgi:hypothetical protein
MAPMRQKVGAFVVGAYTVLLAEAVQARNQRRTLATS